VAYYEPDVEVARTTGAALRAQGLCRLITELSDYDAEFDVVVCVEPDARLSGEDARQMARLTRAAGFMVIANARAEMDMGAEATGDDDDDLECAVVEYGLRPCDESDRTLRLWRRGPALSVIIPVYNAADDAERLLQSIRATRPGYPLHWVLLDDASPDPHIRPLLESLRDDLGESVTVVSRDENRGFVLTCNEGMILRSGDDVILLNSDTIVYDGWARGLVQTAYEDANIGTVTPLSNNCSAFSVLEHVAPENAVNAMLQAGADLPTLDIPVGVGFCLYVKRGVLDRVGVFDPIFGRGYGEECDLCMRALDAGYRNVLSTRVFVYHRGGASMVAAGVRSAERAMVDAHEQIIQTRYPEYEESIQRFLADGGVHDLGEGLARRYIEYVAACRPSVAMVAHNDVFGAAIGGTEFHVRDLIKAFVHDYVVYVVSPKDTGIRVTGCADGVRAEVVCRSRDYGAMLAALAPGVLHIHHLMRFPREFLEALARWPGRKIFTAHDYFSLCPSPALFGYRNEFCGVPARQECGECARRLFDDGYEAVERQRAMHQRLLDTCEVVIAPSHFALKTFQRGMNLTKQRTMVIPHPVLAYQKAPTATQSAALGEARRRELAPGVGSAAKTTLTVGFIGYGAAHKGQALVEGIVAACARDDIRFVAIGNLTAFIRKSFNGASTGLYQRHEAPELIRRHGVDVMVIPSVAPETYSFTLTESWLAGTPAVVGPIGAPAERVVATGAGLVMPDYQIETFVSALRSLASDRARLDQLRAATAAVRLPQDAEAYRSVYMELGDAVPHTPTLFSQIGGEESHVTPATPIPFVEALVRIRKRIFPVRSRREWAYLVAHDLIVKASKSANATRKTVITANKPAARQASRP
ncbi:MAG TPA: glycosyltransferase, partial [Ktedonobacterales bacterium]|nr:glycosyltransferase [Ktedonobacterales bacterium]